MNKIAINSRKAVIYCRVSTKEQVEEGNSLTTQEKHCREYAAKNGYVVAEIFIEEGESAKSADRIQLQRLLRFCANQKNGVAAVIAYKIDRVSRNTDDYSQIRMLLRRYGVEIKSTSEFFENTPAGRFMENIISNVAQFDNDVRVERCTGGMKEAMLEGRYVWRAPLGYSNARINGKSTIVLNESAPIVRDIFEKVSRNFDSAEGIRLQLIKSGLLNFKGKPYARSQYYRMLRNRTYTGSIVKFGECHPGLFEPLVSQEVFDQVQLVLNNRGKRNLRYRMEHEDFPLRRFVTSPTGRKLTGCWSRGRNRKYAYYLFQKEKIIFRKSDLEKLFQNFMSRFKLDKKHYDKLQEFVKVHLDAATRNCYDEAKRLKHQIQSLKENQSLLVQKNLQGIISNAILKQELEKIDNELMKTSSMLFRIPEGRKDYAKQLEYVKEFFINPQGIWHKMPLKTRIKMQWFYFPKGVTIHKMKSKTDKKSFAFKAEQVFVGDLSHNVDLTHNTSNHQNTQTELADHLKESLDLLVEIKNSAETPTESPTPHVGNISTSVIAT